MDLNNMAVSMDNLLAAVQRNADGTVTLRFIEGINGAVMVNANGAFGPIKDREVTAPGTTQGRLSWPPGYGPRIIRMRLKDGTDGDKMKVCFDAPSIAIATTWLADDGSASTPRMYRAIHNVDTADANSVGDDGWTEIVFSAPLEYLDYVGVGTLGAGTIFEVEAH